jgi:beta-N-acetylhexosaminidase
MRTRLVAWLLAVAASVTLAAQNDHQPAPLDAVARRWVDGTLASMSLDEKVGQLLMPGMDSTYISTDSAAFARLRHLVQDRHVGGIIVFGGTTPAPGVLLNPTYSTITLGDPLSAAATLNRLQRLAKTPLLTAGDFEYGVGMRIRGATTFPRAMAIGATGDPTLAERAARTTAAEMRALGIHMNFAPVADVNNNPRNPVINTRSFGEDPSRVSEFVAASVRGLQDEGVLATLKHFPGHGDTAVDTHLDLATVPHDRARLDATELVPFRGGIQAGSAAVMIGHLQVPAIEPDTQVPATLSHRAVSGLLRSDLGFEGLVVTDSMSMEAVTRLAPGGEAAVRALEAGDDIVLRPPDDDAAFEAMKAAVSSGRLTTTRIDASVRRVLAAKARLGLHLAKTVPLDRVQDLVGTDANAALADDIASRAVTLLRDAPGNVPLKLPSDAHVLYVSILDYGSNWYRAAPGSTLVPALRKRWPELTAIELLDRSPVGEIDVVRATAREYDAVIIAVYVRTASGSGRMDIAPALVGLIQRLAGDSEHPVVLGILGNPYAATPLTAASSVLLTYDLGPAAELSLARALGGERPVTGKLPIVLPGMAPIGAGISR